MMNSGGAEIDTMMRCASCGIAGGGGDVKLKDCSACKLVKYCGVECQRRHRKEHKKECKRRAAELRDEILFKQPESSFMGDCPICCLPLSLDHQKYSMVPCCCTVICHGCLYANAKREFQGRLGHNCPFCRSETDISNGESDRKLLLRAEANDPFAIVQVGQMRYDVGNFKAAFEYYSKAAGLGDISAHHKLSNLYWDGKGVEKDEKRSLYHTKLAAIGGHHIARYNLGYEEERRDRMDRAVKHWIIAANMGYDKALVALKHYYLKGLVNKEDLTALFVHIRLL